MMMRHLVLPLLFACTSIQSAQLVASDENPVTISDSQREAMNEAIRRGEQIYLYDQAAWHTTDTMLEDIKNPGKSGMIGWIVVAVESGYKAIYYGKDEAGPFAVYSAIWTGSEVTARKVSEKSEKPRLTDEENRLISALDAAREVGWSMCNKLPPNTVVLPRLSSDAPDSVYVLTSQPDAHSYSLGGHTRFDIKDGKIIDQRQFTKSCLTLDKQASKKEDVEPASFVTSHLLDNTPTEIHVFTMLTSHVPIIVVTTQNSLMWSIGRENREVVYDVDRVPPADKSS